MKDDRTGSDDAAALRVTGTEIVALVEALRSMQARVDALAAQQQDLREQLRCAEQTALDLHQKLTGEQREVGGES
jgi:hypothetical protein